MSDKQKPTKLFVCQHGGCVTPLRKILGPEWHVITLGGAIIGRRFDEVVVSVNVDQLSPRERLAFKEWVGHIKTWYTVDSFGKEPLFL